MIEAIGINADESAEDGGARPHRRARTVLIRWLASAVLATVGGVIALLTIDIGLAIVYPDVRIITHDPRLGTLLRPNLSVRKAFGGHERVVTVTTNAFGLRGPDLPVAKPPGTRRILALGDSFTFGDAVQIDEAWPSQLERRLNGDAGRRFEVINAGVGGYGTAHALLLADILLPSVQPDVVVLGFSVVNDILDNLCVDEVSYGRRAYAPCFSVDAADRLVLAPPPTLGRSRSTSGSWGLPGSRAAEFFRSQLHRVMFRVPQLLDLARHLGLRLELPYVPATIVSWYDERYSEQGWTLTRRLLVELRDQLSARGLRLMILIIPASLQAEGPQGTKHAILRTLGSEQPPIRAFLADPVRPQALIGRFCAEAAIECVDTLPTLVEAETTGQRAYYPLDQHWTPHGHGLAADMIATRLRQLGWADGVQAARGPVTCPGGC